MVENKLKICFVFKDDIFKSNANVNRMLSLVEGLKPMNSEQFIYGLVPFSEKIPSTGLYRSVKYSYPKPVSRNFTVRSLISFADLLYRFPKYISENKINIVYLYSIPMLAKWIILLYKFYFKFKIVEESSEYPLILLTDNKIKKAYGKFIVNFSYRFLDGMVVISERLLEYYKRRTSPKTKFEIINMTVDVGRFDNLQNYSVAYDNYLAYCGSFNQKKDGIITLINAFEKIVPYHPEINLLIIGKGTEPENYLVKQKIGNLNLEGKVILTGLISKEEMPSYLTNATGLVLPRPTSFQAEGGFPSKLGEYLATGKPVIATKVGEIPKFLIDGENAYLAEPDSVESLVEKMRELLKDEMKSKEIGLKGKQLTDHVFNHFEQSKKLYYFLNDILVG